jgi:hypothetical protein
MDDSGDRYGDDWDETRVLQSINRFNHSSNPKDPVSGFRMPSDYFVSTENFETKSGAWNWQGIGRRHYREGKLSGWQSDHVGTAGPCLDGLSMQADPNTEAQAITECLNKLGDVKTAVLSNLITAGQTANLLGDTVKNLAQALMSVKKGGVRKGASHFTDAAGNLFLIYQYGWKPLVSDVEGAVDLMTKQNLKPLGGVTRNISKSIERTAEERGYRWTSSYTHRAKCKLWAEVDDTWQRGVQQAGAGVEAIPFALWDIVPWSFVVDWVLPVGNVLEALGATAGLTFKAGYISNHVSARADITNVPPPDTNVTSDFGGIFNGEWYQRRALSGFPLPQPYVKSPFSTLHALESLALLRQLRHKL